MTESESEEKRDEGKRTSWHHWKVRSEQGIHGILEINPLTGHDGQNRPGPIKAGQNSRAAHPHVGVQTSWILSDRI